MNKLLVIFNPHFQFLAIIHSVVLRAISLNLLVQLPIFCQFFYLLSFPFCFPTCQAIEYGKSSLFSFHRLQVYTGTTEVSGSDTVCTYNVQL